MELFDYEKDHLRMLENVSSECTLFLKRNNDFPLKVPGDIDLYGNGIRHTIKGGTGSGNVDVHEFLNIEQAFERAGFNVRSKKWLDLYDEEYDRQKKLFIEKNKKEAKEKKINAIAYSLGQNLAEFEYNFPIEINSDVAIYVLARNSGEGRDREVVKGEFLLTDTEIRNILFLNKKYKKFMLVLNVAAPIDLTPILEVENIFLLSQLGTLTSTILVEILLGNRYPSGKLADTWAKIEDYPFYQEFAKLDDTFYKEDIFVGYRYFETFNKKPTFEFGYGKGYTDFEIETNNIEKKEDKFSIDVDVKNIGKYLGKEVVQLYLESSTCEVKRCNKILVGFAKTKELKPNENDVLNISFSLRDFPIYNPRSGEYYVKSGMYNLSIGNSSKNTATICSIYVNEDIIISKTRTTLGNDVVFNELKPDDIVLKRQLKHFEISKIDFPFPHEVRYKKYKPDTPDIVKTLSDKELVLFCLGDIKNSIRGMIGQSCEQVLGGAGETCLKIRSIHKSLSMVDGPAGLRICKEYVTTPYGKNYMVSTDPMFREFSYYLPKIAHGLFINDNNRKKRGERHYQYTTAIPVATALAQSFSRDVLSRCGDIVRNEMEMFGVDLWLAPAMNIHRHVLCGRNFEYYSEDPFLTSECAIAIIKSVQSKNNKGVVVKHFACNNQETNRTNSNSVVSARALREIYLLPYQKVIKEATPVALMVSYNLLNGIHTSENYTLLNDIIRCEFAFDGLLMTDWYVTGQNMISKENKYPYAQAYKNLLAGINICMPGGKGDIKNLMNALKTGKIERRDLIRSSAIIANTIYRLKRSI